ncbi:MAG: biotin synthase BioB [Candidatus Omnitrophica bacterium]|nr:biotin synthase BioB [Candidatus Omnitrophota bacterium]
MIDDIYQDIYSKVEKGDALRRDVALRILDLNDLDTFSLLHLAYLFRRKYYSNVVLLHVINNVQNGHCGEDCQYCAQSKLSAADIEEYPMKSDSEILGEAEAAYQAGAYRYCMVFSGRGSPNERIDRLVKIIRNIKQRWPIEVCVSPGTITLDQARKLKDAGLDRLNHNLNTSKGYYSKICTTHSYEERVRTLKVARSVGLSVCSGVILGMGEVPQDVVEMAMKLREVKAESIPVNFLIPIPGTPIGTPKGLSPEYCLRVLCLFRLLNPEAEIRIAAGREMHLRSLEPIGLYVANSLFLQGYLNVKGESNARTLQMIKDMGFRISSEMKLDDLLKEDDEQLFQMDFKDELELRPFKNKE